MSEPDNNVVAPEPQDQPLSAEEESLSAQESNAPSAFDNINASMLILLARIYDVQLLLLRRENPEAYEQIYAAHAQGRLLAPPPSLIVGETDTE